MIRLTALGFLTLVPSGPSFSKSQAPVNAAEAIEPADTCELLSRGPGVAIQKSEVTLHVLLEKILADLQKNDMSKFAEYFDPKVKKREEIGDKIQSILSNRYNAPLQYSIFRIWRIQSPTESKVVLESCEGNEGARVISSFGYKKQFAVWIQVMGQNELGRLILSIASHKGKESIVGFRIQQWTQSGEDANAWAAKAEAAEAAKNLKEAYFEYDVAQKLLDGKDFVVYPLQAELIRRRDGVFTQKSLLEAMNADLKINSLAYVGSLLAKEGTGIFLREFIAKELPSQTLQDMCRSRGASLQKTGWLTRKQGLRCNFLFKGMNPLEDSGLGGIYMTADDLHPSKS